MTDPLTGLGTRLRLEDKIIRLIAKRKADPAPFAIAIVDLDGFKPINDLYGRSAGDGILKQAALRLRAALDDASTVTRTGSDEFTILSPFVFSAKAAERLAYTLVDVLSAPYDIGARTVRLTASVGSAIYDDARETPPHLIAKAETALYEARRSGRNRVVVYSPELVEAAQTVTRIEQALRRAVSNGEVEPWFQPIVSIKTRRVLGFEALARWRDPDLGVISPATFIPIAEERGIMPDLSRLILLKAAETARNWPDPLFLSFNLSSVQLINASTAGEVIAIADRVGFDPRRLEIEITETGLMSMPETAASIITEFKDAGVRIALDDFGTGQSSLGRLREFPFDKLKIDRSFVSSLLSDRASEHIVKAILAMCIGLEMEAVAEGIEEEAQAARLDEFGCALGQGYLYGRAVPAAATGELAATPKPLN
ncbi:putative bifunctional diguanylate cyclase/phosphodiesterase [Aliihoeflea sp. PC F10.4]